MSTEIDGVVFCDYVDEVNEWIAKNPDKIVVDVKLSSAFNSKWEEIRYCCLILYKNK